MESLFATGPLPLYFKQTLRGLRQLYQLMQKLFFLLKLSAKAASFMATAKAVPEGKAIKLKLSPKGQQAAKAVS